MRRKENKRPGTSMFAETNTLKEELQIATQRYSCTLIVKLIW